MVSAFGSWCWRWKRRLVVEVLEVVGKVGDEELVLWVVGREALSCGLVWVDVVVVRLVVMVGS